MFCLQHARSSSLSGQAVYDPLIPMRDGSKVIERGWKFPCKINLASAAAFNTDVAPSRPVGCWGLASKLEAAAREPCGVKGVRNVSNPNRN